MQLTDIFCYTLLTITMSSICVNAERGLGFESIRPDRRLRRRETSLMFNGFNTERIGENPKVIYKRLSKHRYFQQRPKYHVRSKPRFPPKPSRRPAERNKGKMTVKYNNPHKKRASYPKHGSRPAFYRVPNIAYGPHKKKPYSMKSKLPSFDDSPPKNTVFKTGELSDFQLATFDSYSPTTTRFGEPPVDSYGAPIKPNLHDLTSYDSTQSFPSIANPSLNMAPVRDAWNKQKLSLNNELVPSKGKQMFTSIDDVFVTPIPMKTIDNDEEELTLNSYSDIYNYRQKEKSKKKSRYINPVKLPPKQRSKKIKEENEIIVGGQYAEPPVRFIQKTAVDSSEFEDEFLMPLSYSDPDGVSSANQSPYVNYKNSNMAFSPQNLNDAFSIN